MMIKDSGNRTNFESGAVRDIQSGKGRCDLMPLGVVATLIDSDEIRGISLFKDTGDTGFLYACLKEFCNDSPFFSAYTMLLEVAKHFEEGAEKYGRKEFQFTATLILQSGIYLDTGTMKMMKGMIGLSVGTSFVLFGLVKISLN